MPSPGPQSPRRPRHSGSRKNCVRRRFPYAILTFSMRCGIHTLQMAFTRAAASLFLEMCSFGHAPARRERFVTDQATYQLAAWRDPAGRSPPPPAPRGPPELRRTLKDLRTPAQLLVLRVHPCTIDTSSDSDPRARCAGLRARALCCTAQHSLRRVVLISLQKDDRLQLEWSLTPIRPGGAPKRTERPRHLLHHAGAGAREGAQRHKRAQERQKLCSLVLLLTRQPTQAISSSSLDGKPGRALVGRCYRAGRGHGFCARSLALIEEGVALLNGAGQRMEV
jgi:hypothetical protein